MSVQVGDKFKSVKFSKTGIKKGYVFEVRNIDRNSGDNPLIYDVGGIYAMHENWVTNGWMVSVGDEE